MNCVLSVTRSITESLLWCLLLVSALPAAKAADEAPPSPQTYTAAQCVGDFDALWQEVSDSYAYLDQKATDWAKVREQYRPQAERAQTRHQFIALLEGVLEELYDPHMTLNTNTSSSPRLVPTGADIWAEWRGDQAAITEVRRGSAAERAGVRPGMLVSSIDGVPVRQAVRARLGRCLRRGDAGAEDWALRVLLAGRHDEIRHLRLRHAPASPAAADVVVDLNNPADEKTEEARMSVRPLLVFSRLRQDTTLGYIGINNSLGDTDLIRSFDAALAALRGTQGLIIDLRDTPSGGNTTVARGILSRFVDRDVFYQKHDVPSEQKRFGVRRSWEEIVSPRGPFRYPHPVVVLVDHWTASMGEGIAVGFDAAKRASVVGTRMAGLNGAVASLTLPNSGIGVAIPEERVSHPNGTPREEFLPPVLVDLYRRGDSVRQDLILEAGIKTLRQRIHKRMNEGTA